MTTGMIQRTVRRKVNGRWVNRTRFLPRTAPYTTLGHMYNNDMRFYRMGGVHARRKSRTFGRPSPKMAKVQAVRSNRRRMKNNKFFNKKLPVDVLRHIRKF